MSVLVHFTSTTQDAPAGQLQETPYTVIRATRRDNLPGGSSLQGFDVSVDRFLDRSQIERLICQIFLKEKPRRSSILGVGIYYKLSDLPRVIGGTLENRIAEYLWNGSLPGERRRLIIDRDADGVHVPRGYEFDHTAACSPSDR